MTSAAPTSTAPTSTAPTSTAPSTSAPSTSAAPGGGADAACDTAGLRITVGRVDAGAGQRYLSVVLTNTGPVACTLRGHPGIDGQDAAGRQVAQARRVAGTTPAVRVTLAQGGSASTIVHAKAVPSGSATACPPDYVAILVTPPDRTTSTRVAVALPACGGLDVRPIVAGTAGM